MENMADIEVLQDDIIMDEDPEVITIDDDEEDAETKKEEGNRYYKLKSYSKALKCYSDAIQISPTVAAYYGNRSACYMMLLMYKEALEDARKSVLLDPNFVKGYVRMLKCFMAMGDFAAAKNIFNKAKEIDPHDDSIKKEGISLDSIIKFKEEADKSYEKKEFRTVVFFMDRALGMGGNCAAFKLIKAECLTFIGRYQEAQEIANDILRMDKQNVEAIYVRGMCLYYEDNVDHAFQHFQHALKLDPDHRKVHEIYKRAKLLKQKKEDGNLAFKANKLQEAYNLYSDALLIDPDNKSTNAKLYLNRAIVSSKLGRMNESISDCSAALELDSTYMKARLRRAKNYMDTEAYEEAVRDYEEVCKVDKSRENKRLLQEAKFELKKSKRKDYYKILGVDKNATTEDIKKAYRKRALVHHPDRHASASEADKRDQEKKFKEIGEAYGILSDPKKRVRYDNGQDMDDMDGMADIDPNRVFHAFFGDSNFSFGGSFNNPGFAFQYS